MERFGDVTVTMDERFVATVEMHQPPENFFEVDVIRSLADAYEELSDAPDCRAILLCAEGKHFCAGANIGRHAGEGPDPEPADGPDEMDVQAARLVGAGVPVDFAVVRENTEGSYAGEGGWLRKGTAAEVATQGSVNTRFGVERCTRFAFELAASRRHHLTLVHKTNVLTFSGDLWQRVFNEVAAEYPGVQTAYNHVDAACIYMVESPQRYDVNVTDNLFGDILTDLSGAIAGGIGLAASANLNPARTGPSLFEPVHGSAPDIVGTGKANPSAAIISAAMMLDHLGLADQAARITKAVRGFVPDAPLTTSQFGDQISERV